MIYLLLRSLSKYFFSSFCLRDLSGLGRISVKIIIIIHEIENLYGKKFQIN